MRRLAKILIIASVFGLIVCVSAQAGYIDECMTKGMQMNDTTHIFAVQCKFLDFFVYTDENGDITRRNFVPVIWQDLLKMIDFIPEDRIYAVYQPDPADTNHRGIILDFDWKIIHETDLAGMRWATVTQGAWWGLVHGEETPIMREVSFDGYESVDYPCPEIKGADYYHDLRGFAVDSHGNWVMLFCHDDEDGNSGNGIVRVIRKGKQIRSWIIDIPYVPEISIPIKWVGPVIDHDDNIIIGHYENPCKAINRDRVRVHKFTETGVEKWSWGEELYIISDIRVRADDSIEILRPGGPIYHISQNGKYMGEHIINEVTVPGEPDCGQNAKQ